MDNNELDKILKEKLQGKIQPSKQIEERLKQTIKEQQSLMIKQNKKADIIKLNKVSKLISVAAVFVIVFTVGIYLNGKQMPINIVEEESAIVRISAIEPTKSENGIIASDSVFLIHTEQNVGIENLKKSLYLEPALDYTIEKTANAKEYKLKFKQNIPDNTIVKLQYIKDQITEGSWAYQTSNKLSVISTFPTTNAETVSTKTAIEIEFSYAKYNLNVS